MLAAVPVLLALALLGRVLLSKSNLDDTASRRLYVSRTQQGTASAPVFPTVRAAWEQAQSGDTIVVLDEVHEEALELKAEGQPAKGVTIESGKKDKPVVWRAPREHPASQPIWHLAGVAGLRFKGFQLDGQNHTQTLVFVTGHCPGLTLEDVHGKGFEHSAITLRGCRGDDIRPVVFQRLRLMAQSPAKSALSFDTGIDQVNEYIQVQDSRLEGLCDALVAVSGPLYQVGFYRNRFHRATEGILFKKRGQPYRVHLAFVSNTLAGLQYGLHWHELPAHDAPHELICRNNLFVQTRRLAQADQAPHGVKMPAQWIWLNEGDPAKQAPAGTRYFRKTFDLPNAVPAGAQLNICCDDAFAVWLNGEQVGRSRFPFFTGRVLQFDIGRRLRAGKNALAVEGTNATDSCTNQPTPAGLLVFVTFSGKAGPPVVSDASWQASATADPKWMEPDFRDDAWQPARVVAAPGKGPAPWNSVVWDMAVNHAAREGVLPLRLSALGNVCDRSGTEANPCLEARPVTITLPTDTADDAWFLRYPRESPLARLGPGQTPVGAGPANAPPVAATVTLITPSGGRTTYPTVRAALEQAKDGDRIAVEGEVLTEEPLAVNGKVTNLARVELFGVGPTAGSVLWRCPLRPNPLPSEAPSTAEGEPLLHLTDVAELTIRGFVFDGQNRVRDLIVLSGRCSGLRLEDVAGQGFLRSAVRFHNFDGGELQPATLQRLRTTVSQRSEAALLFTSDAGHMNQNLVIRECRLEGPCPALVEVAGGAAKVEFLGNRFYQAVNGFRYRKAPSSAVGEKPGSEAAPHPFAMLLSSNTFHDLQTGVYWESLPPPEQRQVVARNNLFTRVSRPAHLDGVLVDQVQELSPPLVRVLSDNYRDTFGQDSFPSLGCKRLPDFIPLGTNPDKEREFLRYPSPHRLSRLGPNETPVGQ